MSKNTIQAFAMVIAISLSGCISNGGFRDFKIDDNGNKVYLDNASNFESMAFFIDEPIKDELQGLTPSAGYSDWNSYWLWRINNISSGKSENPNRYILYIIDRRKAEGLPDLVGLK